MADGMGTGAMPPQYGTSPSPYGAPNSPTGPAANPQGTVQVPPRPQQQQVQKRPVTQIHLDELLEIVTERNASDLHIAAGIPPIIRRKKGGKGGEGVKK